MPLLLMSDELSERLNAADEEYGYPRVEALFAEVATESPDAIIQRLTQGGEEWADGRPQDDDITLVVLNEGEGVRGRPSTAWFGLGWYSFIMPPNTPSVKCNLICPWASI